MISLTLKQKLAWSIAFVNTVLVILIVSIFTFAFNRLSTENIKNDLLLEAEEIVTQHIAIVDSRVTFTLDGNSYSIEQDLLTDRLSAVIFTAEGELIGSFGYFESKQYLDTYVGTMRTEASQVCTTKDAVFKTSEDSAEQLFELLYYPIIENGACRGTIIVGASLQMVRSQQELSLYLAIGIVGVVLLINTFAGLSIADALLKPLKGLVQKMHQVSVEQQAIDLLPLTRNKNDEVNELIASFNDMVIRVKEGITKQKEFIANASHELKTPIARVVSDLDIASLHLEKNSVELGRHAIEEAKSELTSLHHILESLLTAARITHTGLHLVSVDLRKIVSDEVSLLEEENVIDVKIVQQLDSYVVHADALLMEIIMRNCLQNALKYNIHHGQITIITKQTPRGIDLIIENTTTEKQLTSFSAERFARADKSVDGYGIGLSIVKELCEVAGYKVEIGIKDEKFVVEIFPIAPYKK